MWPSSVSTIISSAKRSFACDTKFVSALDGSAHYLVLISAESLSVWQTLGSNGTTEVGRLDRSPDEIRVEGAAIRCAVYATIDGFRGAAVTDKGFLLLFTVLKRADKPMFQFSGASWHDSTTINAPLTYSVSIRIWKKLNCSKDPPLCIAAICDASAAESQFLIGTHTGCIRTVDWSGKVGSRLPVSSTQPDCPQSNSITHLQCNVERNIVCALNSHGKVAVLSLAACFSTEAAQFEQKSNTAFLPVDQVSCISLHVDGRALAVGDRAGQLLIFRLSDSLPIEIESTSKFAARHFFDVDLDFGSIDNIVWASRSHSLVISWERRCLVVCSDLGSRYFVSHGSDPRDEFSDICPFGTCSISLSSDELCLFVVPKLPDTVSGEKAAILLLGERAAALNASVIHQIALNKASELPAISIPFTSPANLVKPLLISDQALLKWRRTLQTRPFQHEFESVAYSQSYLQQNWPIRLVCQSPCGLRTAISGTRGLAICSTVPQHSDESATQKWRVFGNINHELRISACLMAWLDDERILLVNESKKNGASKYELLCFPRRHLDFSSLLGQFDLSDTRPVALMVANTSTVLLSMQDGQQLILNAASKAPDVQSSSLSWSMCLENSFAESRSSMPLCNHAPSTELKWRKMDADHIDPAARSAQPQPKSKPAVCQFQLLATCKPHTSYSPSAFQRILFVRCAASRWGLLLLASDHRLWSFWSDSNSIHLVATGIDQVWVPAADSSWLNHSDDSTERNAVDGAVSVDESCLPRFVTFGLHGTQLWFVDRNSESGFGFEPICAFDADMTPIGINEASLSLVFMQRTHCSHFGFASNSASDSALLTHCTMQTKSLSLIPGAMRYWLSHNMQHLARQFVLYWQQDIYLTSNLESLLLSVVDDEQPHDRLPAVMLFLQSLKVFPSVLANAMRKSDNSQWNRLLACCGNILLVFEASLQHGLLQAAASLLLIIEHVEGPSVTRFLAVRVLHDALAAENFRLAQEITRFLMSSAPGVSADFNPSIEKTVIQGWQRVMEVAGLRWLQRHPDLDTGCTPAERLRAHLETFNH